MIKKLLPIIMLLIGSGAGVGAGLFLKPPAEETVVGVEEIETPEVESHAEEKAHDDHAADEGRPADAEYVKLSNQFVVPIVHENKIASMVVMSLSVEAPPGTTEAILNKEPKLRNEFLRVLFDFASVGGFNGDFLKTDNLDGLRRSLREAGQRVMGKALFSDILILEIARQDY